MHDLQATKKVFEAPASVGTNATASLTVDTLGYDSLNLHIQRGAMTVLPTVFRLLSSDQTAATSFAVVDGSALTPITSTAAALSDIFVDLRGHQRYFRFEFTPASSAVIVAMCATLARAKVTPDTPAERGVTDQTIL